MTEHRAGEVWRALEPITACDERRDEREQSCAGTPRGRPTRELAGINPKNETSTSLLFNRVGDLKFWQVEISTVSENADWTSPGTPTWCRRSWYAVVERGYGLRFF